MKQASPHRQAGFTALEVVISIALVTGIAVVGTLAYHARQTAQTSTNVPNVALRSPKPTATVAAKTEDGRKLTIGQLGITLDIPEGINGLRYEITPGDEDQSVNVALIVPAIEAADKECSGSALLNLRQAAYGQMVHVIGSGEMQKAETVEGAVHVGSKVYFTQAPEAACSQNPKVFTMIETATRALASTVPSSIATN